MLALKLPRFKFNRKFLVILAVVCLIYFTFFWRLGSLTTGISSTEVSTRLAGSSINSLIDNPINAPHSATVLAFQKIGVDSIFGLRLASVLMALLFIFCFYKISRMWFGNFVAWISTLMFASSPLVVLAARNAGPEVMYLLPVAIYATYSWLNKATKPSIYAFFCLSALVTISLYTPGMAWLVMLGVISVRSNLKLVFTSFPKLISFLPIVLALLIISPLTFEIYHAPSILSKLLLIPTNFEPVETLRNIGWGFLAVFWHSLDHNVLQIGRLPLLNIAQITTSIFGIYALWARARSKTYAMLVIAAFSILGSALADSYSLLLIALVISSVLSAAGIRYLLKEWMGVFPRNPFPRMLATAFMCLLVVISMSYGLRYSLIAWPNTLETKSLYVLK